VAQVHEVIYKVINYYYFITATAVAQVHEVIYYDLLLFYYCYCRGTSARGDLLLFIIILLLLLPWHKCTR